MIEITGLQDLEKFSVQASAASNAVENDVNEIKQDVAGYVFLRMMRITTVDTSKAISNWKIRTPNDESLEREAYFPGDRGSTRTQSHMLNVRRELPNREKSKIGDAIYISNNLDYVEDYLENKDQLIANAKKAGEFKAAQELGARLQYFK